MRTPRRRLRGLQKRSGEPDPETWLTELAGFLLSKAGRLKHADEPLPLLDEICAAAMQGVARLKGTTR